MENQVSFEVYGKYAMFSDPIGKIGGEKYSYHVPTYEALKGITRAIYWKPTFIWVVDKVRVIHQIRTFTKGVKWLKYNVSRTNGLSQYTYLVDVKYQVLAHFEWNLFRDDLDADRSAKKHLAITNRMIEKGGKRNICLGTTECQAYVEKCDFGSGSGHYDSSGELTYGLMFHGFDYPTETGKTDLNGNFDENGQYRLHSRFFRPTMIDGIISFPHPKDCSCRKYVHDMKLEQPSCDMQDVESVEIIEGEV